MPSDYANIQPFKPEKSNTYTLLLGGRVKGNTAGELLNSFLPLIEFVTPLYRSCKGNSSSESSCTPMTTTDDDSPRSP